ncbi:hypothetical protein Efla_001165 [Eimeria flavescens]
MTAALLRRRPDVSLGVSPAAVSFDAAAAAAANSSASASGALEGGRSRSSSPSSVSVDSLSPLSLNCSSSCLRVGGLLLPRSPGNVAGGPPLLREKRGPPQAPPTSLAVGPLADAAAGGPPPQQPEATRGRFGAPGVVYLVAYLVVSPLLSACNKRLYGGAAKSLHLSCCLLQQLILCCCLFIYGRSAARPQQQQQRQQQQQQEVEGRKGEEAGLGVSLLQQLQLACPYVLMLWCSNACLAVSSLASYQVARCSSIPIALFLEVCSVSPAAAAAAGGRCRSPLFEGLKQRLRLVKEKAAGVGGLRALSAVAVAAGLAAATLDGNSLQPHAALLGVAASAAGAVYLQLASECFAIRSQPQNPSPLPPPPAAAAAAAPDNRSSQEIAVAQRVAVLSILLLLPLIAVSQEPQQLLLRIQQQQQQQQGLEASDVLLLLLSGCLAALLPLCTQPAETEGQRLPAAAAAEAAALAAAAALAVATVAVAAVAAEAAAAALKRSAEEQAAGAPPLRLSRQRSQRRSSSLSLRQQREVFSNSHI